MEIPAKGIFPDAPDFGATSVLNSLTVGGFKSIRALEDFELRSLNALIGPNGAGKSNFISLFYMLAEMAKQRLQVFVAENGGPDDLLFGGRKQTRHLNAKFVFGKLYTTKPLSRVRSAARISFFRTSNHTSSNPWCSRMLSDSLTLIRLGSVKWDPCERFAGHFPVPNTLTTVMTPIPRPG